MALRFLTFVSLQISIESQWTWCHWKDKPKWIISKKKFLQKQRTDPEKTEDANFQIFVYWAYDLQDSTIETSVFSYYKHVIFIWKYLSERGNLCIHFDIPPKNSVHVLNKKFWGCCKEQWSHRYSIENRSKDHEL